MGSTRKPLLYNITLTVTNTEYSQAITAPIKQLKIQARTAADIRIAFVTGKVATPVAPYYTVKSGAVYTVDGLDVSSAITVYLGTSSAGTVVEIEAYK